MPVDGGHSKVAGRACQAPTDCRESSCTRGAREGGSPPLPSWRVVDREWAATQGPSESPSPLTRPAPFDKGASASPPAGVRGAWRRTTSAASLLRKPALAVDCPAGAIIVRSPVSLCSTVAPRAQPRTASKQRQFSLVLSFAAKRKNNLPGGSRSRSCHPPL